MLEASDFNEYITLPVLPMKNVVLFPTQTVQFELAEENYRAAVDAAMAKDQLVFLSTLKIGMTETTLSAQLETVGTIGRIRQVAKDTRQTERILVEGVRRASLTELIQEDPFPAALVEKRDAYSDPERTNLEYEAIGRQIYAHLNAYFAIRGKSGEDLAGEITSSETPDEFANRVLAAMLLPYKKGQPLLDCFDSYERLERILALLMREISILELEKDILNKTRRSIEKGQREFFLREQLKVIQDELGDQEGLGREIKQFREKLREHKAPEYVMEKCEYEITRLKSMASNHPESSTVRNYLAWMSDLPWGVRTQSSVSLKKAERILNRDHYGLDKVKQRILEYLAVQQLSHSLKGPILCLVGPPGVGKTSIARSVAESLNRNYIRISLGGVRDEADIRGHRVTYIGALPGRIVTGLKQAGSSNPLMLLDEIDKMSSDFRGDPSAAMLEVLDSEQNSHFHDHFLDVEYDLSDVLFIATANSLDPIPKPLLDRMEVIELTGYSYEEKYEIGRKFLLPRQKAEHGISEKQLSVTPSALREIADSYTREAGVRTLERRLGQLCRRAARMIAEDESQKVSVTNANLEEFLGPKKYILEKTEKKLSPGVATGLAWTSVGGVTLAVEAGVMKGKGSLKLTGQLGDVMKESAQAAMSFVRSNADELGIDSDFYERCDIHIHVPEGATPKDGPSAGITITTALVSALTGRSVRGDVAMTGEVTLRGRVLPIGGLKEKAVAAYRAGIKTVIIPAENKKDLPELGEKVLGALHFEPVKNVDEALSIALTGEFGAFIKN